ncbi:hypothetical protein, partial [Undibacterium rugosum]|uniref:hypothetical protein n=1 Tax=Undibacterium rugosum TaxID=2762291 RepID=UPI001B84000A
RYNRNGGFCFLRFALCFAVGIGLLRRRIKLKDGNQLKTTQQTANNTKGVRLRVLPLLLLEFVQINQVYSDRFQMSR